MEQKTVPSSPEKSEAVVVTAEPLNPHARCPATHSGVRQGPSALLCRPSIHPIGANDDALPLQLLLFQQRSPRVSFHTATVGIRFALCRL